MLKIIIQTSSMTTEDYNRLRSAGFIVIISERFEEMDDSSAAIILDSFKQVKPSTFH